MQGWHSILIIITTDTIPNILAGYILIAEEPEFFSFAVAHGFDFFTMLIMIPLFRFHVMTPPKIARVRMLTIGIRPKFSAFLLPSQKLTTTKQGMPGEGYSISIRIDKFASVSFHFGKKA